MKKLFVGDFVVNDNHVCWSCNLFSDEGFKVPFRDFCRKSEGLLKVQLIVLTTRNLPRRDWKMANNRLDPSVVSVIKVKVGVIISCW